MYKKQIFALAVRFIGFAFGVASLLIFSISGEGFMRSTMMIFFTIHTNIFTTVMFGVLFIMSVVQLSNSVKKKLPQQEIAHLNPSFQLAFTFYITITFVIYWALLSWMGLGTGAESTGAACANILLHAVVPLLAIFESLLFLPHGRIAKNSAFTWLTYPLLYLIFIIIRAQAGGAIYEINGVPLFYPYPFVDPAFLAKFCGSEYVMIPIILGLVVLFWAFALLYITVDKKIGSIILDKKYKAGKYLREFAD